MKSIKEKLEIEYLKSLTYTEINEKMNMLNDQINQLKDQLQLLQSRVVESVCIDDVIDYRNCQLPKGSCDLCRW
jgi:hypothetical protein